MGRWLAGGAVALGTLAAALATALAILNLAGELDQPDLPGLAVDPGITVWLLPVVTVLANTAAVITVGCLLAAAFLAPGLRTGPRSQTPGRQTTSSPNVKKRRLLLSPAGFIWQRTAFWAALGWAAIAAIQLVLTASDLLGVPPADVLKRNILLETARSTTQGQTLLWTFGLAGLVAVICRVGHTVTAAAVACLAAAAAVTPAAFAGHAAGAGDHQLAVSGLILHVIPVTLWLGGLLALLLSHRLGNADRAVALRRFSGLALGCLVAVAGSGAISVLPRLRGWSDLIDTGYGRILLLKLAVVAVAGALGWFHRTKSLPAVAAGRPWVFTRVAAVELGVLAIGLGAGVALSETAAPKVSAEEDVATSLLGYSMPGPITAGRLVSQWLWDPLIVFVVAAAVVAYLIGVARLLRRGDRWPWWRIVGWLAGWTLILFVTSSGVGRYAPVLFSVHMAAHMVLTMLAPILLVLGGPVTLALRAFRPTPDPSLRGCREWVAELVHHPVTRMMAHPLMALGMYVVGLYAMYFTGLYELALRSHAAHLAMIAHLVGSGYFFFWLLIGVDPAPRPVPHPVRVLLLFVAMVFHAIFGLAIMQGTKVFASDWYGTLARDWGPSPLDDQRLGGGIAWAAGELPAAFVLAIIVAQWFRADGREQRRIERHAELSARAASPVADPHVSYNEYLAALEKRSQLDRRFP